MSQALFSTVPTLRSRAPTLGLAEQARTGLAAAFAALAREWRLRQDRHALESLDEAALADIGIGPGQEEGAVRHGRANLSRFPTARPGTPLMPASWTEWR